MTFDHTKAHEVNNGIVLDSQNGVGVYSGNGSPVGADAPIRSYYFDSATGLMWFKYGNLTSEWREVRPEFFRDHHTLFTSNGQASTFNGSQFKLLATAHADGIDAPTPGPNVHELHILGSQQGTGNVDIRLWDVTNNAQLAILNFTETTPTHKTTVFTPPAGVDFVVEVQGRKQGNSTGELWWAAIVEFRDTL